MPSNYWVQDFGGRLPEALPPVVAGSHAFLEDRFTSFFLNYYDSTENRPLKVIVNLDGTEYYLGLDTGIESAGTYRVDVDEAAGCREYFFQVTAGDGTCYRYPGTTYFYTYGEGNCLRYFD